MYRTLFASILLLPVCSHPEESGRFEPPLTLKFIADYNIPTGTALQAVEPSEFGGISGIAYEAARGKLLALSDARLGSRYYLFHFAVRDDALEIRPEGVTYFRRAGGGSLRSMDPEGLALSPDGNLYLASEGDFKGHRNVAPALFVFSPDGALVRELPVPAKFLPSDDGRWDRGVRDNLAFESLALSPDGKRLFLAAEGALIQDDEETNPERGARARIIEYAVDGDDVRPVHEYAYDVDPVHKPDDYGHGIGENGLVELLTLDDKELLALERSFFVEGLDTSEPRAYQKIRIYWVTLEDATDIHEVASLREASAVRPARKALVLDLEDIVERLSPQFPTLDNFEGMCFGPQLANGNRTLILVSDNNFKAHQRTAFLAFEVVENRQP